MAAPRSEIALGVQVEGVCNGPCLPMQDHCHYQGYVEGSLDSLVAVSTCSGLR